jgi:hypothetical protein
MTDYVESILTHTNTVKEQVVFFHESYTGTQSNGTDKDGDQSQELVVNSTNNGSSIIMLSRSFDGTLKMLQDRVVIDPSAPHGL